MPAEYIRIGRKLLSENVAIRAGLCLTRTELAPLVCLGTADSFKIAVKPAYSSVQVRQQCKRVVGCYFKNYMDKVQLQTELLADKKGRPTGRPDCTA